MPLLPFRSKTKSNDLDVSVRTDDGKQQEAEATGTAMSDGAVVAGGKGFMDNSLKRRLLMRNFPVGPFQNLVLCLLIREHLCDKL